MRRILLTGASGFVGRQVLRSLLARGEKVRIISRTPGLQTHSAVEAVHSHDLFSETDDRLAQLCDGVDIVVHCAWYAEPGKYLFSPQNLACLRGTLTLAAAAEGAAIRRFVGIGTCFEYALGVEPLRIDTPLDPQTPYAAAKAAAFLALSQHFAASAASFAWCRLFYLFGEGEDERRFVAYLKSQLAGGQPVDLTEGRQVRDFLDVAEAGRRIAEIALSNHQGPANICSGQPITVRAMAEGIADCYGRRDLLRFGARMENAVDPPVVVGEPTPPPVALA